MINRGVLGLFNTVMDSIDLAGTTFAFREAAVTVDTREL